MEINPGAKIIDTGDNRGRRVLKFLAYRFYMEEDAEAVFCMGTRELKELLYEMESRGSLLLSQFEISRFQDRES